MGAQESAVVSCAATLLRSPEKKECLITVSKILHKIRKAPLHVISCRVAAIKFTVVLTTDQACSEVSPKSAL